MDNENKSDKMGFSRRGLLKIAGIIGAGIAAGSSIIKPSKARAAGSSDMDRFFKEPGNPVMTEFLYDPDTGEVMAACVNETGKPKLSTDPERKNAWVFEQLDHAQHSQDSKQSGIILGGPQGQYRVRNGRLENNPYAARTIPVNAKPFE